MDFLQNNLWKMIFVIFVCVIAYIGYKGTTRSVQTVTTTIEHNASPAQTGSREATDAAIKEFILNHPEVIIESMERMQQRRMREIEDNAKNVIKEKRDEIESTIHSPFAGNANGDVVITVFYDYSCSYCRKLNESLNNLLDLDNGVKVIYKPFPILGEGSEFLSRLMLAIYKTSPEKFKAVHDGMMDLKTLNKDSIKAVVDQNGLDLSTLEIEMDKPEIRIMQAKVMELATVLRINGAPASVIGEDFYPGLLNIDQLKAAVSAQRSGKKEEGVKAPGAQPDAEDKAVQGK